MMVASYVIIVDPSHFIPSLYFIRIGILVFTVISERVSLLVSFFSRSQIIIHLNNNHKKMYCTRLMHDTFCTSAKLFCCLKVGHKISPKFSTTSSAVVNFSSEAGLFFLLKSWTLLKQVAWWKEREGGN